MVETTSKIAFLRFVEFGNKGKVDINCFLKVIDRHFNLFCVSKDVRQSEGASIPRPPPQSPIVNQILNDGVLGCFVCELPLHNSPRNIDEKIS